MHRVFAIVVLLLMQFQLSWAAAAGYCGHEANLAQVRHFGHHEHQHGQQAGKPAATGQQTGAQDDLDCGLCHGLGAVLTLAAHEAPTPVLGDAACCGVEAPIDAPAAAPPDRPQWLRLA